MTMRERRKEMSMRDQIARIIFRSGQSCDFQQDTIFAADAIMRLLPELIAPLVWETGDGITASKEYFSADAVTGGRYWTMEGQLDCSFDLDAFHEVYFNSDTEAQAAANAHHRAAIMSAFKGEDK